MYQLISAVGKSPDLDGRYYPVNLINMPLSTVFKQFTSVIATVNHSSDHTPVYLNLDDLPYAAKASSYTLPQWFQVNGNKALPTTEATPIGDYISARFADFWLNDFSVKGINRNFHPDMEIVDDLKIDVMVSKAGVDYTYLANRTVASVNGFIHRVDHLSQGLVILDGGKSVAVAKENQLGMIDFSQFGEIETISITDEMVYSRDDLPLKKAVFINVPVDLRTKTVLVVIGGYLQALDKSYRVVGHNSIRIDFANLGWTNRFFNSREFIDLSALGIEDEPNGSVGLEALYSDETIRSLMTLSQSFLIVLDKVDIDVGYVKLDYTGIPGTYRSFIVPVAPIILGDGRIGEYKTTTENGQYSVVVAEYLTKHRILERGTYTADAPTISDVGHGAYRHTVSDARYLMITKTLLEGE